MEPGARLGPYEILSPLGAGGMGEVYRARDGRLKREVALKVLPLEMRHDPVRRARFEQEARAIGALNHPGIVIIHDVGDLDGTLFIVTELIDGESLRQLMGHGPVPLRVTLSLATQVAESLGAAHAAGIIHRDLKPENIMVTRDGRAKVLDFGLAKPRAAAAASEATLTIPHTDPGTIVGTPSYMSPEQVAGRDIDYRSDIFAFGAILHEMLSGKPAFREDTAAETMTAILKREAPDLPLTVGIPGSLERMLRRCLEKEPARRFHSASDLAFAIEAIATERTTQSGSGIQGVVDGSPRRRFPKRFLAGLAAGIVLAAIAHQFLRKSEIVEPPAVRYFTYSGHDSSPAVAPGGRSIAFTSDRDGRQRIWLKQMPSGGEAPLTEGPDDLARFSPDGSMILFLRTEPTATSLYRSSAVTSEARKLLENVSGADWSPEGNQIVFLRPVGEGADASSVVGLVDSEGENMRELTRVAGETLRHPRWSPDGQTIAAVPGAASAGSTQVVFLIDARTGSVRRLAAPSKGFSISGVSWSGEGDQLVYSVAESVTDTVSGNSGESAWVVAQNIKSGEHQRILWSPYGASMVDIVGPGRMVFDTRSPRETLREFSFKDPHAVAPRRWLTRGNSKDRQPAYAPDGERLLFSSTRSGNLDLWEISASTGVLRRVTDSPAEDWDPAYMPDGKQIVWSSNRGGNLEIWIANAGGLGARQVTHDGADAENPTATPDGAWILYTSGNKSKLGIWKIHPDGSQPSRIVTGNVAYPETSPDGKFVSYSSNAVRDSVTVRVARVSDAAAEPFQAILPIRNANTGGSVGRSRWMPDGRSLAFIGQSEGGINGIFVQDFAEGKDTSATIRPFCCFDADAATESFGISPKTGRLAVAAWEQVFSLVVAERVPNLVPATRPR